ncbi:hypothetical protein MD484_g6044, partial [Candolleomyces efflorescens]
MSLDTRTKGVLVETWLVVPGCYPASSLPIDLEDRTIEPNPGIDAVRLSASIVPTTMSDHAPPPQSETHTGSPTDFLKGVVGKKVIVRLVSGVDYRGVLSCLDGYMNIAMEQTEEYVNGSVTNRYGDTFIRGNNVLYISAAEPL